MQSFVHCKKEFFHCCFFQREAIMENLSNFISYLQFTLAAYYLLRIIFKFSLVAYFYPHIQKTVICWTNRIYKKLYIYHKINDAHPAWTFSWLVAQLFLLKLQFFIPLLECIFMHNALSDIMNVAQNILHSVTNFSYKVLRKKVIDFAFLRGKAISQRFLTPHLWHI